MRGPVTENSCSTLSVDSDFLPQAMPRVGVSACLLGKEVRFDGGHKRCRFITDTLVEHFEFLQFCPEVAIGMGTPRQPVHLVAGAQGIRAIGVRDAGLDVTLPLKLYCQAASARPGGNHRGLPAR